VTEVRDGQMESFCSFPCRFGWAIANGRGAHLKGSTLPRSWNVPWAKYLVMCGRFFSAAYLPENQSSSHKPFETNGGTLAAIIHLSRRLGLLSFASQTHWSLQVGHDSAVVPLD